MEAGVDYIGVGCGALIVNDKHETLLLLRKSKNDIGKWCKPGGSVEFGEAAQDAVKRECREEIGVEIELLKELPATSSFVTQSGKPAHWVSVNFVARIVSGEPKNAEPDKHAELQWFPLNALPENLTQTTKEPIEAYLASLRQAA